MYCATVDISGIFSIEEIADAIRSVTKSHFPTKDWTTEWTIVYNKSDLSIDFYHREDFENRFQFEF